MKRVIKPALVIIAALLIVVFLFISNKSVTLSSDQKKIRDLWGTPEQFMITYLPRGEQELVRFEVWYYPKIGNKVSFLAGKLASNDPYQGDVVTATRLIPEDFDFEQNEEDVKAVLGNSKPVESLDYLPAFYEDSGAKTFYSEESIFIIESDHLTYFQTVGAGDKSAVETELQKLDVTPTPATQTSELKTYTSSDLGLEMNYPVEWFLQNGVLSSYDTGYLEKGLPLPDQRIKCDFISYSETDVSQENPQTIREGDVVIKMGTAKDNSGLEGPGLGAGIIFVINDNTHKIALLCYDYAKDLEAKLFQSLNTFKFLN
jgi:hypothetical protein